MVGSEDSTAASTGGVKPTPKLAPSTTMAIGLVCAGSDTGLDHTSMAAATMAPMVQASGTCNREKT